MSKNKEMLTKLKAELKASIERYYANLDCHPRMLEEIKNDVGVCLLKLSELAMIKYNFNKDNGYHRIPIDTIQSEITKRLWDIIVNKFDPTKLKGNNSIYNFLMKCANNLAMYLVRDVFKKQRGKIAISYERLSEKEEWE